MPGDHCRCGTPTRSSARAVRACGSQTGGRRPSMRVTRDPDEETRAAGTDGVSLPGASSESADRVSDRVRASRRARRRARFRQAVESRRRGMSAWRETLSRGWIGIALLVLLAGVFWIEVSVSGPPAGPTAQVEPSPTTMIVYAP